MQLVCIKECSNKDRLERDCRREVLLRGDINDEVRENNVGRLSKENVMKYMIYIWRR